MQWLLCQYIYSWVKPMYEPLTPLGSLFPDILGNLLSDYTANTEDTKDTCLCVKLYCR